MKEKTVLMDMKGAKTYLGISLRSMERLVAEQEIEIVRLPGIRRNLFRAADLDKLIDESTIVPTIVPTKGRE